MQPNRLTNCVFCGKLFLKNYTDYCLDCYKEIEQDFTDVDAFLKKEANRQATLEEIGDATGVSTQRIAGFLREGRIYGEDFPNLGYACSHCGKLIKRQVLCNGCFSRFSADVSKSLEKEKFLNEFPNSGRTIQRTRTSRS